jgi:hypothetical protein
MVLWIYSISLDLLPSNYSLYEAVAIPALEIFMRKSVAKFKGLQAPPLISISIAID